MYKKYDESCMNSRKCYGNFKNILTDRQITLRLAFEFKVLPLKLSTYE